MDEYAWIGSLESIPNSQVILVISGTGIYGHISTTDVIFEVGFDSTGQHIIKEIDQSRFPPELDPSIIQVPGTTPETAPDELLVLNTTSNNADPCTDITVLVAYTPEAKIAEGGTSSIRSLINMAVAETNQTYINSGMNQRIRLVHTMETAPGEATNSFHTDLSRLRVLTDGYFDRVDDSREQSHADLVALIIYDPAYTYCGMAYLNSSAESAFSVTDQRCATGNYTFAHELGHNMGARHDWFVDDSINYHKGYVNLARQYRTVMAYSSQCSGDPCYRVPYWSNPEKYYNGTPMGISKSGPMNCIEGSFSPHPSTCAADNRTRLNETCAFVANFRRESNAAVLIPIYKLLLLDEPFN